MPVVNGPRPEQSWRAGFDLWYNFAGPVTLNVMSNVAITANNAQTIYTRDKVGKLAVFSVNTLPRTDMGILSIGSRTNLDTHSQEFDDPNPTKYGLTINANSITAPDGSLTADKLVTDTANTLHRILTVATTVVAASIYTVSVFAKAAGYRYLYLNAAGRFGASATFDLQNGTITQTASGTARITPHIDGWYQCEVTGAAIATDGYYYLQINNTITNATDDSFLGDGSSGIYLWNEQTELGSFAGPPILTVASTVNRAANYLSVDLTSRLGTGVAGLIQLNQLGFDTGSFPLWFEFNDGGTSNVITLYLNSGAVFFEVKSGAVQQALFNLGSTVQGIQTIAFAVGTNFALARIVGGSLPSVATSVSYPAMSSLNIGSRLGQQTLSNYQFTRKLALSFGAQSQATFDATYAAAIKAHNSA